MGIEELVNGRLGKYCSHRIVGNRCELCGFRTAVKDEPEAEESMAEERPAETESGDETPLNSNPE
jgi:hypothetical protein